MRKQKGNTMPVSREEEEKLTVGVHFSERAVFQKLKDRAKAEERSLSKMAYLIIKLHLNGQN
jgi:hypothetical protein